MIKMINNNPKQWNYGRLVIYIVLVSLLALILVASVSAGSIDTDTNYYDPFIVENESIPIIEDTIIFENESNETYISQIQDFPAQATSFKDKLVNFKDTIANTFGHTSLLLYYALTILLCVVIWFAVPSLPLKLSIIGIILILLYTSTKIVGN